jgi:S-adenosylmethionine:tRNA ribosyltransferase-isomerase
MDVKDFDFSLPSSLIAQTPLKKRTDSRLMALNKQTGEISHHRFDELIQFLSPGDVLVLNDTKVIPGRLFGVKRETGAKAEVLLLKELGEDRWETLVKPAKRLKTGTVIDFGADESGAAPAMSAIVEQEGEHGKRILHFQYQGIFHELLDRLGTMPLPPYIHTQLEDKDRYQTVYAKEEGSAAAPTAGLHFTEEYLRQIGQKGVTLAYITLHVGLGTFRPVVVSRVEEHQMHSEYYRLSAETAEVLNEAKSSRNRIIAVGTTTVRTLETLARRFPSGRFQACDGWTDIFIYPGYQFRLVDAMVTNFHLPKSSLIMLVSAFAGREKVLRAYEEAIAHQYRFFSFGDAMFLY